MDKITSEIKLICLVSIFAGIISAVIPPGKLKGAFSSFCAIVVVFTMVSPLGEIKQLGFDSVFTADEEKEETLALQVKTAEIMLYESMIESATEDYLAEHGFEVILEVECSKEEDKMEVLSFTVKGDDLDDKDKKRISELLTDGFENAKVLFEEE